ncbi:MAG: hypothetical protein GY732_23190, partial [Gammaproteobacteria bacterium]|nr:hypothetical protein [Gammaproteobacteria bacterium]
MKENTTETIGTDEKNTARHGANPAGSALRRALKWGQGFVSRHQGLVVLIVIFVLAIIFSPVSRKGNLIFLMPGNLTDLLRSMA